MKNLARRTVAIAAVLGTIGVLAACSATPGDASGEPIKIGVVGPQSGPLAEIGENQVAGAQVAVDQINAAGGILGREVQLSDEDEQTTPETATAAVRNLSNSGVNLVVGMLSSAGCLALAPQLASMNVALVDTGCTNDGLTGQNGEAAPFSNLFRTSNNDSALIGPLAQTIAEKFPEATDYSAFGYDYVTGTTQWDLYQDSIKDDEVDLNVVSETFVPIGEQNFGLQVQQLVNGVTDPSKSALYLGTFSSGTGSFLQQAASYDLSSKFAVIVNPGGYYPIARTLNGLAPNVWNAYDYNYAAFDNDENAAFVEDYKALTGKLPVDWSYDAYVGVLAMKAAIEKAGSTETAAVVKALAGLSFDTPGGELTIDAKTHQANPPVVITNTVGDASAEESVKVLETVVVPRDED
ncbi:ABC transporter substrate-binding protein [Diaminobutyricimonas sp. TR449]|uniref:ABC transporter substrate-binding protein n=1 Tax=Diaminobutyricimonas sp. TR449 TaxID=2708076 RepID=UPI00141DCC2C|nr:ABC transporter substrate-binding protein [Diaminobutyricimonas sp. TR449]